MVVRPVRAVLLAAVLSVIWLQPAPASSSDEDPLDPNGAVSDVLRLVRANYVDEVDAPKLVDAAIQGLLRKLDPHSNYLDPKRLALTNERNRGEYDGIGISFALHSGHITVISAIEGTPSDRLGIRPGDRIVEIDGVNAFGLSDDEVFARLRGQEGTTVAITIAREGEDDVLRFNMVRERIPIKSVPYWFLLDQDTGYVRMVRFSAHASSELARALDDLESRGMKRLILDLRGNPGGYLEQAVAVADQFLDNRKLVVYTKGRVAGAVAEHRASGSHIDSHQPLIVIIDHGSASAAEIVAGAIQDWDRGLIVGQTSFGKGLVQRQYRLWDGSALFLTIGRYYTPAGRLIQREYEDDRVSYYAAAYEDAAAEHRGAGELYLTAAGRRVFGGGGIAPDVRCDPEEPSPTLAAVERAQLPFAFAQHYIVNSGFTYPAGFERFLTDYELDDTAWTALLGYAAGTDLEIGPDRLAADRTAIAHSVKREMAAYLWGPTERYRVLIAADSMVARCRDLFSEADGLLALHDASCKVGAVKRSATSRTQAGYQD